MLTRKTHRKWKRVMDKKGLRKRLVKFINCTVLLRLRLLRLKINEFQYAVMASHRKAEVFHTSETTSLHPPVRPVTQQVAFPSHSSVTNKQTNKGEQNNNDTKVLFIISPLRENKTGCKDHALHFSNSEAGSASASPTHPSRQRKMVVLLFLHPLSAKNSSDGQCVGGGGGNGYCTDKKARYVTWTFKKNIL